MFLSFVESGFYVRQFGCFSRLDRECVDEAVCTGCICCWPGCLSSVVDGCIDEADEAV